MTVLLNLVCVLNCTVEHECNICIINICDFPEQRITEQQGIEHFMKQGIVNNCARPWQSKRYHRAIKFL